MEKPDIRIDKTTPIPLYYQLKESILANIKSGAYPPGYMVPKEQDLCAMLGISRTTVRQAITELVHEGWLYRVKSKGTFVARPKIAQDFIQRLEPFNDQIERRNMVPRTKVIEAKKVRAPKHVAERLGLQPGAEVVYLYCQRFADEEAIVTIKTYLPFETCAYVLQHDLERESLYAVLSEQEETAVCMVHRTIEAVEANAEDTKYMNIRLGKAVQLSTTVGYNGMDRPIEFSVARYRGDRNSFDVKICVDNAQYK